VAQPRLAAAPVNELHSAIRVAASAIVVASPLISVMVHLYFQTLSLIDLAAANNAATHYCTASPDAVEIGAGLRLANYVAALYLKGARSPNHSMQYTIEQK